MALTKTHRWWNDSHYNTGHLNNHTKEWAPITNPTRLATTLAAWRWERMIETADISLFWTDSNLLSNCMKNSRKCCLQSLLCCFLQYPPICVLSPWTPLKPRWWQQGHSKMIYWKTTEKQITDVKQAPQIPEFSPSTRNAPQCSWNSLWHFKQV